MARVDDGSEGRGALAASPEEEKNYAGLSARQLVDFYRLVHLSRTIDDREIVLKNQQKIYFQISSAGHEVLQVAAALNLRAGHDWFYTYYRERALVLALGVTPYEQFLQGVGAADDPASGGRQMPSHWSCPEKNIVSGSSPTGSQLLQAVGCAEAGRYFNRHPEFAAPRQGDYSQFHQVKHQPGEIVYTSCGEGTTSEGEFWEMMSTASNERLPMLIVVQDNGYAISTPVELNTPGGNISRLVAGFPNFHFEEVDGTSALASYAAFRRATAYIREGKGPAFVHGHVTRPYSHAHSDDERNYRSKDELAAQQQRDPVTRLRRFLLEEGILDEKALLLLEQKNETDVQQAADKACEAAPPAIGSIHDFVYSPALDPTSEAFATAPQAAGEDKHRTMADLINRTLHDEMRRDPRILVFGEDVADCGSAECLHEHKLKGKGGVFKITHGLQREFGGERVFDSPLAEANIVGRANGMATRGLKPVVEIQFFDYIWPAMHQIRNELATLRWRSNNRFSCPAVIRCAIGGYLTGGAIYHSQSGEVAFTHIPGLRVVMPSCALDAAGLLRTALRCDDPVLFLEHKRLYRESYGRAAYPGPEYMIPFGKAAIVKPGTDLTVVTYGATVPRALQAAQKLEREHNIRAEILDLRTLSPYDFEAIAASVTKTSRVLVLHEDARSWGYGAEIAARIADELFDQLDAPVRRLAATDTFIAYQPALEDAILPQPADIYRAMKKLAEY
jgi:2-oxoisovalerate dehydrogenase E1 component